MLTCRFRRGGRNWDDRRPTGERAQKVGGRTWQRAGSEKTRARGKLASYTYIRNRAYEGQVPVWRRVQIYSGGKSVQSCLGLQQCLSRHDLYPASTAATYSYSACTQYPIIFVVFAFFPLHPYVLHSPVLLHLSPSRSLDPSSLSRLSAPPPLHDATSMSWISYREKRYIPRSHAECVELCLPKPY